MKKTYVLDTNVLLSDPRCFNNFQDNDLVVPILVLEELDRHKGRSDEVGRNCREVSRYLDALTNEGSLKDGIETPGGGILRVMSSAFAGTNNACSLPPDLKTATSVDNMIIEFVLKLRETAPDAILVSKDINVRVKCAALGISAQDYLSIRVSDNISDLYTGVKVVEVDEDVVDRIYRGDKIRASEITSNTYPHQIVVVKAVDTDQNTIKSALTRIYADGSLNLLRKFETIFGVRPRNKEQSFSCDLLMDPAVKLVTLTGRAGCGKTLLALAAALEQLDTVGTSGIYQKLVISRPVQPVGRDIGFLPGTLTEKMEPWISPVRDNLEFLFSGRNQRGVKSQKRTDDVSSSGFKDPYLSLLQHKGLIEVEAITYIRGRSIPNTFIIIDEAQNLSMHELKTIVTRVGENSKIVLTGDIEQIDNVHVDTFTNGLTYAIEKFKEHDISGHVTLLKGERSALATLASKIL